MGPEDAADNPGRKREGRKAQDSENNGDSPYQSQRRQNALERNKQPAVERCVLGNECDVRNLPGDRAEHVIDLVEVVADEGKIVDRSYRTEQVKGTTGAYDHSEADANPL